MEELKTCPGCGVPIIVSENLSWEANGVIAVRASPRNRFVFCESESIDEVLAGIEEMIGLPIAHIVLESRSREARRYIERSFPAELRAPLQDWIARKTRGEDISPETEEAMLAFSRGVTQAVIDIGRAYGYGDQGVEEAWESAGAFPWRTQIIRNPHSLLNFIGDNLGSVEAFEGIDMQVSYEEIGEGAYRLEMRPGEHPIELKERLKRKRYEFKPGGIRYTGCPQCGIPLEVSRRRWDLERGIITDPDTGRRMAIFGPLGLDAVFEDLEAELGVAIDDKVIEAQRRYIKEAWSPDRWNRDSAYFQREIAVRGLGNLVDFEGDAGGVGARIENACLHLMMVGTMQALVELVYGAEDSRVEWGLADDGDLSINVKVR